MSLTEPRFVAELPEPELCRRVGSLFFSNLFSFDLSLSESCEFDLLESEASFEGGEADDPPLTLVISPDLRSTPTIDHGLGFGNGFGLGPKPVVGVFVFSSTDDTACAILELTPIDDGFVELEMLEVLGFASGNFSVFDDLAAP